MPAEIKGSWMYVLGNKVSIQVSQQSLVEKEMLLQENHSNFFAVVHANSPYEVIYCMSNRTWTKQQASQSLQWLKPKSLESDPTLLLLFGLHSISSASKTLFHLNNSKYKTTFPTSICDYLGPTPQFLPKLLLESTNWSPLFYSINIHSPHSSQKVLQNKSLKDQSLLSAYNQWLPQRRLKICNGRQGVIWPGTLVLIFQLSPFIHFLVILATLLSFHTKTYLL